MLCCEFHKTLQRQCSQFGGLGGKGGLGGEGAGGGERSHAAGMGSLQRQWMAGHTCFELAAWWQRLLLHLAAAHQAHAHQAGAREHHSARIGWVQMPLGQL